MDSDFPDPDNDKDYESSKAASVAWIERFGLMAPRTKHAQFFGKTIKPAV